MPFENFDSLWQKSQSSLCSQSGSQQHQVCRQCSHIVEGFEDMQSSRDFRDGADREMRSQQHDILMCAQQQRWQPLNKEVIRPQRQ